MSPMSAPALFVGNQSYPINTGDTSDTGTALAINNKGYVVGWSSWEGTIGTNGLSGHGFLWVPTSPNATTGTMEDMNTVFASVLTGPWAGYVITDGLAINDNGDVLVRMSLGGTGTNSTGTVALISTPWPAAHHPGDANRDGTVNISDLSVVLTNYDKTGMTLEPGRLQRRRHREHQRPEQRADELRQDVGGVRRRHQGRSEPGRWRCWRRTSGLLASAWRRRK